MDSVQLKDVSKSYGEFVAVDALTFAVPAGGIYGLLGPNGAGKTSTIRMLMGITLPDRGEVTLFGRPFDRRQLRRIGYLPEERGLYRRMKVLEHLVFLGELHGMSAAEAGKKGAAWCERLDLADWTKKKVEELSKGMQQKVQFIAALLHEPEIVILDEPFYGLDPVNTTVLKDALLEFRRGGRTILFSTHRMDQVEKLCDAICLINHGRAVLEGDLKQIKARFGRNTVQIAYEGGGDGVALQDSPLVDKFNDYGNYVEVRLHAGADPQELLRLVAARNRISRFELMEPSLEEIFIETVGKSDA
jgi:ABC-2 type transport system ATP-binding protein